MKKKWMIVGGCVTMIIALFLVSLWGHSFSRRASAGTDAASLGLTWSFLNTLQTRGSKECEIDMKSILDALIPMVEQRLDLLDEPARKAMKRNITYIAIYINNYSAQGQSEWSECTATILDEYYVNASESQLDKAKTRWGSPRN